MQYSSHVLEQLVEQFSRMPGIGRKTAQRLAFYVLNQPLPDAEALAQAIRDAKARVTLCEVCGNLTEEQPCLICRDEKRETQTICVVEQPVDVLAIERTGGYRGRYHVLNGVLSPLDGVGPEELGLQNLVSRVRAEGIEEIIVATNTSVQGEATAMYVSQLLAPSGIRVTRIARGIPVGSELEFSDQATLTKAFEGRQEIEKAGD
jgi:recombination protein RecR